jgi:hypothetical protein
VNGERNADSNVELVEGVVETAVGGVVSSCVMIPGVCEEGTAVVSCHCFKVVTDMISRGDADHLRCFFLCVVLLSVDVLGGAIAIARLLASAVFQKRLNYWYHNSEATVWGGLGYFFLL